MPPFELTLLISLIAVVFLAVLSIYVYITELSEEAPVEEKPFVGEKTPPKELVATAASPRKAGKKLLPTQPQTDSSKCPYGFGYLKELDQTKNPIPDECVICPRILECTGWTMRALLKDPKKHEILEEVLKKREGYSLTGEAHNQARFCKEQLAEALKERK